MSENNNGIYVPLTAEECMQTIIDLAFDYDGYRKAENLMELIDTMSDYAKRAIELLHKNGR